MVYTSPSDNGRRGREPEKTTRSCKIFAVFNREPTRFSGRQLSAHQCRGLGNRRWKGLSGPRLSKIFLIVARKPASWQVEYNQIILLENHHQGARVVVCAAISRTYR